MTFEERRDRYLKASEAFYQKIKDAPPEFNVAGQDKDGNYLIPEYKEFLMAQTGYYHPQDPSVGQLSNYIG